MHSLNPIVPTFKSKCSCSARTTYYTVSEENSLVL